MPVYPAIEPNTSGIIIRVSGVRVPPPASRFSAVFCALAGLSRRSSVGRPTPTNPSETPRTGHAETTILAMGRSLKYHVLPVFGPQRASEITELDWQAWIDQLARRGLARSTIAK